MGPYDDADLAVAIAEARSWRGVLRRLGLPPQSSSALRSARRRADALGLDHTHFTGQRRWSDQALADAVRLSRTWTEVMDRLGLASTSGTAQATLRSHAARLDLDVGHLLPLPALRDASPFAREPSTRHLDRAAPLLAAAWFVLRGYDVAWPLEPCRYDLLVVKGFETYRVQVKSTTTKSAGSWVARISSTRRRGVAVYSTDEIDYFFVVDGDMTCYLIPLRVVGGYQVIHLRRYTDFAVGTAPPDAT